MIAAVMLYILLITLLISATACTLDRACGGRKLSRRWIWCTALLLSVLLPALMIGVSSALAPHISPPHAMAPDSTSLLLIEDVTLTQAEVPVGPGPALLSWPPRSELDFPLLALWVFSSVIAYGAYAAAWLWLRHTAQSWQGTWIDKDFVWIAGRFGPAVVGSFQPQVIVPSWFTDLAPPLRRAALIHERQHILARDPLLWQFALLLAALMPWNPVLWWQLRRLRLSQEVDCDARVVRSGIETTLYAETLLQVAHRQRHLAFATVALTQRRSQLERRISALILETPRSPAFVGLPLLLIAAVSSATSQLSPPRVELSRDLLPPAVRVLSGATRPTRSPVSAGDVTWDGSPLEWTLNSVAILSTTGPPSVVGQENTFGGWARDEDGPDRFVIPPRLDSEMPPPSPPQWSARAAANPLRAALLHRARTVTFEPFNWAEPELGDASDTTATTQREGRHETSDYERQPIPEVTVQGTLIRGVADVIDPLQSVKIPEVRRAVSSDDTSVLRFDIPSGIAAETLNEFALQSGVSIMTPYAEMREPTTQAIAGEYLRATALTHLLKGTGLTYQRIGKNFYNVFPAAAHPQRNATDATIWNSAPVDSDME